MQIVTEEINNSGVTFKIIIIMSVFIFAVLGSIDVSMSLLLVLEYAYRCPGNKIPIGIIDTGKLFC